MTATYTEAEATRIANELNEAAEGDMTWEYAPLREGESDRYIVGAFDAQGVLVGAVANYAKIT